MEVFTAAGSSAIDIGFTAAGLSSSPNMVFITHTCFSGVQPMCSFEAVVDSF
jgi:hypothetical protein